MAAADYRFDVPSHVRPLRDQVLRFVEEKVYPAEAKLFQLFAEGKSAARTQQARGVMLDLQRQAKEEGLWALGHPKDIGGQGMPFRDYIYVNEVQGRSEIAQVALGTHSLQDSLMLRKHASRTIRDTYLSDVVAANVYPSFAMTEPDIVSSDPTGIQTKAELTPDGKHWIINGTKWWTTNAAQAAFTSVMCRTEGHAAPHASFSIICVPTDAPGYHIKRSTPVLGTRVGDHCEVEYRGVQVPYENLIGKRGSGFLIAQERLGPGRIFHCMRWLGQAQRAFDWMCRCLVDRKVGGRALGDKQLMQEHVFDSYCDISALRLMTMAAAEKMDGGNAARVELAACKAWGARALCRVMDRAVQVHGAKGLTHDTPLGEMYQHARAARFYDGPDEVHISTLSRLILREYGRGNSWDFSAGVRKGGSSKL
ncbi:putative acyl-CoA dehydrogenase IBR3 [Diplonema papillatum]|nr:putative acyl-CoA dehydrogenase IBR3 [Diplonema papillatum]